ncbi:AAA family ATPase [Pokkaliibacter sp. CJK22405]|uniref:AAA family ATPase n=1 Tax=Pokkaliibacter sp. CJK22405 TaxID=3384615 RepID=UPI0039856A4E
MSHFITRGRDYLARYPDFSLVGRQAELNKLAGILMRNRANSVLLVGSGGVGCSALCLGLQAAKAEPDAPFDLISKRFYWLDTDGLFSSGDSQQINEAFQKLLRVLSRGRDTVLILEDTRDFIEAARNNGCTHLINALVREIRHGRFQAIFETRDEDLEVVLKCHSDMREYYTMLDIREPEHDSLHEIVTSAAARLEKHHHIRITAAAIEAAVMLTSKYRVQEMSLSRAQPERALNLLDRAMTSYRQRAHTQPEDQATLDAKKREIFNALADDALPITERQRLLELCQQVDAQLAQSVARWQETQERMRRCYRSQREGEETLIGLEEELETLRKEEAERPAAPANNEQPSGFRGFGAGGLGAFESEAIASVRREIEALQKVVQANKQEFDSLVAAANAALALDSDDVLREFSSISGIAADKLNQDERSKLLRLQSVLQGRVFGQNHAVVQLADAVRVARVGLKDPEKPQASFMFLGPSGTGKTELAKALSAALYDSEKALLRFDMSEYMEKHGVAKLIGAPPGYEGYEAGGILTNSMRANPRVIVLFDEIEKAHPDVFNVLLQVLDDGRLTDNRGLTVSFSEAIILMTTNIGQPNFLDEGLSFDEAVAETMRELDTVYRPEFLNRFNGRQNIVCFNRLGLEVIEKIARREIDKLNRQINAGGKHIQIDVSDDTLASLCRSIYSPATGARGIPGYITTHIKPAVANTLLQTPEAEGRMLIEFDEANRSVVISSPMPSTADR